MKIDKEKIIRFVTSHLSIIFFFTIVTFVLTYPQIRCIKQCVYSTGDQLFYAWILDRNVDSLLHKPLKEFFNANIFYPYKNTLAFGDHLIGETILAMPMLLMYDNPIFAQNVLILLSFIFTAYGMYLLTMHYIHNRPAAVIATLAFTFSNVRFNQYDHLNLISTQWFPFLFLFLHLWLENKRKLHLIAFGVVYLFVSLFTFYYYVFSSFAIVLYIIFYKIFFKEKPLRSFKSLIPLGITLVIINILLIPTLVPYFNFNKEFPNVQRTLYDNVQFSATPMSFLYTAKTTFTARLTNNDRLSESNAGLFLGYIPILLAAIAVFQRRRLSNKLQHVVIFATVSFILYFLLAFGPFPKLSAQVDAGSIPLPYFVLYYLFPPFKLLRAPARFILLADIFLSILAGVGFMLLFTSSVKKLTQSRLILKKTLIMVGLGFVIVMESWSAPLDLVYVELKQDFPPVYHWLAKQSENVTVLELPIPQVTDSYLFKMTKTRHAFLANLTQADYDTIEAYRDYFSTLHKKRIVNGYNAFFPPLYNENKSGVQGFPSGSAIKKIKDMHIDFLIVHTKQFTQEWRDEKMSNMFNNPQLKLVKQFDSDYVFQTL